MVFLSGQLGLDPQTGKLAEGGVVAQAQQSLKNIEALLAAAGAMVRQRCEDHCIPGRYRRLRCRERGLRFQVHRAVSRAQRRSGGCPARWRACRESRSSPPSRALNAGLGHFVFDAHGVTAVDEHDMQRRRSESRWFGAAPYFVAIVSRAARRVALMSAAGELLG